MHVTMPQLTNAFYIQSPRLHNSPTVAIPEPSSLAYIPICIESSCETLESMSSLRVGLLDHMAVIFPPPASHSERQTVRC